MKKTLLLFGCLMLVTGAQAEEFDEKLLLEGITKEPPNTATGIPRPTPGMSKAEVEKHFGLPKNSTRPVGTPAISRWTYPRFIVVFENERVVNSVVRKPLSESFAAQ